MNREEIIDLMSETVRQVNMDIGYQNKVPMEELVQIMDQHHEQVKYINAIVFDTLKNKGLIVE
jgi:hypothetical protein